MAAPGRALLVGGGNIGALYDLDDESGDVRTHARAYEHLGIPFDLVEPDPERARRITKRYSARWFQAADAINPAAYDMVSICAATPLHAEYLGRFLDAGTPLIICEKPVADAPEALASLAARRGGSRSIVVVNYMRRFLPAFERLRRRIAEWRAGGSRLGSVVARYQRGLLNNGGHALDLLELLLDRPVALSTLRIDATVTDAFPADPTVTGVFELEGAPAVLLGMPTPKYGAFELELNFDDRRVEIRDRGNDIVVLRPAPGSSRLQVDTESSERDCLASYMLPVFETGLEMLRTGGRERENFASALRLNAEILRVLAGTKTRLR